MFEKGHLYIFVIKTGSIKLFFKIFFIGKPVMVLCDYVGQCRAVNVIFCCDIRFAVGS